MEDAGRWMCYARIERRHEIVSNGHACLVVPIDVRSLQDGEPARRGGLMTIALREAVDGWRISVPAWTWDEPSMSAARS